MRCAVDDQECVSGRLRRGMCERHYRRWMAHGDTSSRRLDNLGAYEVTPSGCWRWTSAVWRNGYGKTSVPIHGTRLAHRAFYTEHVGPIPTGVDLDHRCHNADPLCVRGHECQHRRCVNPQHLEPIPHVDNLMRAIISRPTCEAGLHDLTVPGSTLPDTHQCAACSRARHKAAGIRYRARRAVSA